MQRPSKSQVAVFVFILAGYVAVRFWNITASCLWFDEIFSVHAAEHPWNSILNFVALDLIHPPLFYILMKMWIAVGGESLLWLRTLPVAFSIVAIVPFVFLCRELRLGLWTAVLAFFLIAVNGSLIKYAQELRMYSMLMCISLFSLWLFARFFRTGKGIVVLTMVNLVLVYTHYFGWLVLLSEVTAILIFQRIKWRPILMMWVVVFVGFLPWLVAVLRTATSGSELSQNIGWMQRPGIIAVAQLVLGLVEPFYYSATSIDPLSIYRVSIPLSLIAITAICVYFANLKRLDAGDVTSSYLLMIFAIVPMVCAFVASWIFPYSIWGTRHLVIVFAPLSILVANAIVNLPNLKIKTFAVTTLVLFVGYAFFLEAQRPVSEPIWCGFETVGREMSAKQDVPVIVFEDLAAYHLWFAFRMDDKPRKIVKVQNFPGMMEDSAYFLPRGFDEVSKVTADEMKFDEMLVIYRASSYDPSQLPITGLANNGYKVVEQNTFDFGYQKLIGVLLRRNTSALPIN
jgi:hypothetical protein